MRLPPFIKSAAQSKPLQVVVIIAAILGAAYFVGKAAGVAKASKPVPLPHGGSDIPKGWDPGILTEQLHEIIDGWDWSNDKEKVLVRLIDLTDGQLVAVYNTYNNRYGNGGWFSSKETLTQALQGEWFSFGSVAPQVISRLQTLKCA